MRNLLKVIIIVALLSMSYSSFAQSSNILVYNYTQNYWYASGSSSSWSTGNSSARGYMIFDVSYDPNGYVSGINDATQFSFYRSGGSKYYSETTPSFDALNRVADPNAAGGVEWAFVQSSSTSSLGDLTMLRGNVSNRNIGNADPNEVASRLDGNRLYYSPGESTYVRSYEQSWRLDNGWTRRYNHQNMNMSQVRSNIRSRLQRRGYGGGTD